ncbi:hypothetical protein ACONUD_10135 [Microbulbifer harenosus]|uniref:Uncharacterized protein n=1 Tax=Microbulbifer harenosus TaxID=2576840 RepID=A0ABY2UD76_9GAMM|nr:hypothetical protein [Microbulbifer harenosus]TLM73364.1 hypothetical protein FDY93_19115 [Microbulbifer harenosus]
MKAYDKLRDLLSAALNYLLQEKLISLDDSDEDFAPLDIRVKLLDKDSIILVNKNVFGEVRLSVWWGITSKCKIGEGLIPENNVLDNVVDVTCTVWVDTHERTCLQGYGRRGLEGVFWKRSAEKDLLRLPTIKPVGYEKEAMSYRHDSGIIQGPSNQ